MPLDFARLIRNVDGKRLRSASRIGIDFSSPPGGADGDFGGGLERAIKAFQTARGLHADGTVGRMTLAAVDAALGASRSLAAASHPAT